MTDRLANLSPERRALLAQRLKQRAAAVPEAPAARLDAGPAPLSFVQEFLWLLDQATPGLAAYNAPRAYRLRGPLDLNRLDRALGELVRRHDIFRSRITVIDGQPMQEAMPFAPFHSEKVDLRDCPASDRDTEIRRRLGEGSRLPFRLDRDLLLRSTVFLLGPEDCVLLLVSHHSASDGSSRGIMFRELQALYEATATNRPADLPPMALQYADFAAWERRHLAGERLERLLGHWKGILDGAPAMLELPTDRPRSAAVAFAGARRHAVFPPDLLASLQVTSKQLGSTLFMTLLAAWQTLLHRYTGQSDIVVGSPMAGRTYPETEEVIGYFANTLVLRSHFADAISFPELVAEVRAGCLDAYEHREVPFEKLALELQTERGMSQAPIFQVLFSLEEESPARLALPGIEVEPIYFETGWAKLDLSLNLAVQPEGLRATIEYRSDLFDAATIDRLFGHFETLLRSIVDDPGAPIADLVILPEAERAVLIDRWNATAGAYTDRAGIHQMFEAQAALRPEAPSVGFEGTWLSFGEVNRRANQLAHHLRRLGAAPGVPIGLCLDRSAELVIGLLGVLKSGSHYVPLDPEYPADRLAFMVSDAEAPIIVTSGRAADLLPPTGARVVRLDRDASAIGNEPPDNPDPTGTPDDLAYLIYTSGSTGRPKGVMIPHRCVANYLDWMQSAYPIGPSDCVLQKAPVSFDASVWEFYLPLVTGARMLVAAPGGHQDAPYLVGVMQQAPVTIAQFVPSQLMMLLETEGFGTLPLRHVFCGGEALPGDLLERLARALPAVRITNLYGPTEATVYATHWTLDRERFDGSAPIGKPIRNARAYVLDPRGRLAPIGVIGELHLGGVCVGRGYLKRPELTAEKFVPDPHGTTANARMYRTGDLARLRADGTLEYAGRVDHQVKVRGFRIELSEIEGALAQQPGVRTALVLVREDSPGDRHLVGYYVAPAAEAPAPAALRQALKAALPDYMVPSAFVRLDAMPLSPNGKLDRKALPAPDGASIAAAPWVAPVTESERGVAAIWKAIMGLERVGLADGFFDVGGHSLHALRILGRIRQQFGVTVPLEGLLRGITVGELAARIDELRAAPAVPDDEPALVAVNRSAYGRKGRQP